MGSSYMGVLYETINDSGGLWLDFFFFLKFFTGLKNFSEVELTYKKPYNGYFCIKVTVLYE